MGKNPTDQNHYFLAEWLRCIRVKCGFSQKTVANILNVNRSTYTYYESGKTTPDPMTLHRIARIFGVPIDVFFSEEHPVMEAGDSENKKRRAPKKMQPDPEKVGQLSAGEKEIIAYLRDKHLQLDQALSCLKDHFDDGSMPGIPGDEDDSSEK